MVHIGCDRLETNAALRLLAKDLAVERLPAPPDIKRRVVRFAEQQREIGGAFILQGLNGGIERHAGISAPPHVLAGQDAADAAGPQLASIPGHLAAIDADMADDAFSLSLNQHP